jgi:hypothetical protein
MAKVELQTQTVPSNSAIVAALLRALNLCHDCCDAHTNDPNAQFAWAAFEGAKTRVMTCGIYEQDHAAAAAILAFREIEDVIEGWSHLLDGKTVIKVDDATRETRVIRKALLNLWKYVAKSDETIEKRLAPIATFCKADTCI